MMQVLDACGGFLAAMGAGGGHTPKQVQPLLNQSLIPLTMLVSFLVLKVRYNRMVCKPSLSPSLSPQTPPLATTTTTD